MVSAAPDAPSAIVSVATARADGEYGVEKTAEFTIHFNAGGGSGRRAAFRSRRARPPRVLLTAAFIRLPFRGEMVDVLIL